MKKESKWYRNAYRAAVLVALGAMVSLAPRVARAQCAGDCDASGAVTVNEIITLVNIALGTADASACPNGIPAGSDVNVALIIQAVNHALNSDCPVGGGCGDGVVNGTEECDDGGTCIGGTNAGTHCTAESDCQGEGVCLAGLKALTACSSDADCPSSTCVHCKTFGGDGCAANCTMESELMATLKPGVLEGTSIQAGTSGSIVNGDILTIPLPLTGTESFIIGKQVDGVIPIAQKAAGIQLPRIPVSTIACACVRGSVYKTCGGTRFDADGTDSAVCIPNETAGDSVCDGKKPCTDVFGPGNSGEGRVGCTSLDGINFTISQDAGGSSGTPGPVNFQIDPGTGGPGSQILFTASAIGTVTGACTGTAPDYGADGEYCTDDDPQSARGMSTVQILTTGTVTVSMTNANGIDGNNIGPFTNTGSPIGCSAAESGNLSGQIAVGGFTSLAQPTVGDIVVTNAFVIQ